MKKQIIKNRIIRYFNDETPNYLTEIKNKCDNINQVNDYENNFFENNKNLKKALINKILIVSIMCIFFVLGIFVGSINFDKKTSVLASSIYIDVNPSIEIQIDDNHYVINCIGHNDEGKAIIENINLNGVEINTALYAIVGSIYTNGYIDATTNSILISVDDENSDSDTLNHINEQINKVFKENDDMKCSVIIQKINYTPTLKMKADKYNISLGKMQLIEKIILSGNAYSEVDENELFEMSIAELDLVYRSLKDNFTQDEVISGKPGGYLEQQKALSYVLEYLLLTENDILNYDVIALYHQDEGNKKRMFYLVTIKVEENKILKYSVDCATGEIMPNEMLNEWHDKIPKPDHF